VVERLRGIIASVVQKRRSSPSDSPIPKSLSPDQGHIILYDPLTRKYKLPVNYAHCCLFYPFIYIRFSLFGVGWGKQIVLVRIQLWKTR
jgi:hypothetical protein